MRKDVRQLITRLRLIEGVEVDDRSAHPRVFKNGEFVTSLPSTPSKRSWYQNALAALKRGGIDLTAVPSKPAVATKGGSMTSPFGEPQKPAFEHTVPQSQFTETATEPATSPPVLSTERGLAKGVPTLSPLEAHAFREKLSEFLTRKFGWPETKGAFTDFVRCVIAYEGTLPKERKRYKGLSSASVSIGDFLRGKRGLSVWCYENISEAMLDMEKVQAPQPTPTKTKTKTIQNPYTDDERRKLWDSLWSIAQRTRKDMGVDETKRYKLGKTTLNAMSAQILMEAKRQGIKLQPVAGSGRALRSYDVSRRLGDFLLRANRQSGKQYRQADWLLGELKLYRKLLLGTKADRIDFSPFTVGTTTTTASAGGVQVVYVEQPTTKSTTAPQNGAFDLFIMMIENRSLTKTELMEALSLAEMQAEFESAHPRA